MTKIYAKTKIGPGGRVVIPARLRKQLGLKPGMPLNVSVEKNRIVLEDPILALRALQAAFKHARRKPGEELVSEELIRERHEEAEREGF